MGVDETDPRRAASALLLASSLSSSSASLAIIVLGRLFLALFRAGRYVDAALSSKELVTRVSSTSLLLASSDRLQYTCDVSAMKSLLYVAGFILIESDLLYIIVASVCLSALLVIALLSLWLFIV